MESPININQISFSVVYIEILSCTDEILSIATWFLYEYDSDIYLITNKHVVTWRNQDTWKLLSNTWAEPEKLNLFIPNKWKTEEWMSFITWIKNEISLKQNEKEIWLSHNNTMVDVIAIKFNIISWNKESFRSINKNDLYNFSTEISDQVFVLWYPTWITAWKKLPIWKKWTIASEPDMDYDNLPKFIIDTSTREGMSWAPVISRYDSPIWSGENWKMMDSDYFGAHYNFIWIYSWRLYSKDENDYFTTQLWVVWKKSIIDEIIKSNLKITIGAI